MDEQLTQALSQAGQTGNADPGTESQAAAPTGAPGQQEQTIQQDATPKPPDSVEQFFPGVAARWGELQPEDRADILEGLVRIAERREGDGAPAGGKGSDSQQNGPGRNAQEPSPPLKPAINAPKMLSDEDVPDYGALDAQGWGDAQKKRDARVNDLVNWAVSTVVNVAGDVISAADKHDKFITSAQEKEEFREAWDADAGLEALPSDVQDQVYKTARAMKAKGEVASYATAIELAKARVAAGPGRRETPAVRAARKAHAAGFSGGAGGAASARQPVVYDGQRGSLAKIVLQRMGEKAP